MVPCYGAYIQVQDSSYQTPSFVGTLVFPANHSTNALYSPSFLLRASAINSLEAEVQGTPNSSHIIKFLT